MGVMEMSKSTRFAKFAQNLVKFTVLDAILAVFWCLFHFFHAKSMRHLVYIYSYG